MYACTCLVERSWRFGLPLVLASIKGERPPETLNPISKKFLYFSELVSLRPVVVLRTHCLQLDLLCPALTKATLGIQCHDAIFYIARHACDNSMHQAVKSAVSLKYWLPVAGGFQTVAIAGFVSPVAVAIFGPVVGQALDRQTRQAGLKLAAGCQAACITTAGAFSPSQDIAPD